ncbi:uncharacterized protein DNG_10442 [Cephalotrichum gorgonifer]|uniref:Zn(2)-C6 fungal-type domain-containing protein n=1 Tax=Cephalotrichum gorgonifer TaxID=2041049 RepID=A0AAE8N7R1_9PEZI|nr:uncharacterized protein DNG_10442 [Cephalotrichum gorgonifer]
MTVNKRCGTCIDRKISCDRAVPACSNCVRSNRVCKGYGLRLSWPRDSDRKRSMIGPVPPQRQRGRQVGSPSTWAIHVSSWDMELYRGSADSRAAGRATRFPLYQTIPSIPCRLTGGEKGLFSFFEAAISGSITTFGHYPVGSLIVRIALSGSSLSCVAVQRALLAISCLVRHGSGPQADRLKISAIRALIASTKAGISSEDVAQHIIAGMLLCLFEASINEQSETSNQWVWYICGVKDIMANVVTMSWFTVESGLASLTDWIFYHEVLSQFSRRHWRPKRSEDRPPDIPQVCEMPLRLRAEQRLALDTGAEEPLVLTPRLTPRPDECLVVDKRFTPCDGIKGRNHALSFLARVCEVVLPAWDPASRTQAHRETIAALEREVEAARAFEACLSDRSSGVTGARALAATVNELFLIAILIYLAHASDPNARQTQKLNTLVDQGFTLLAGMYGSERPFPILIIGFEARNDKERLEVLEFLADAVRRKPCGRYSFGRARVMLQAFWNQDDLLAEDNVEFDYMERLTAVVSAYDVLPPLV